jgi:hypothetical protein
MTERPSSTHAQHDLELIAALAGGPVDPADRIPAETLVSSCTACAELLADLRAIAVATATLPAPERTRDFRLRPEDAARLQPRGLRRLVAALGATRLELARPVAPALVALGVVGLLVSAAPALQFGFAAGGAAPAASYAAEASAAAAAAIPSDAAAPAATAGPSAAPSQDAVPMAATPLPTGFRNVAGAQSSGGAKSTPAGISDTAAEPSAAVARSAEPELSVAPAVVETARQPNVPLAVVSAVILLLGVAVFVLRSAARRA